MALVEFLLSGPLDYLGRLKNKVSSNQSQLTETQDVVEDKPCMNNNYNNYNDTNCAVVVDSIGDDGTYGGEEGGPQGVFFFTTGGALVELGGNVSWFYSDTPLGLTSKPIINVNSKAASTSGKVPGQK